MATKTKTIYGPKPTEVSVTQKQTTGTNIATITVNGTDTELYAPNGGSGGGSDLPVGLVIPTLPSALSEDQYNTLKAKSVGSKLRFLSTTTNIYLTMGRNNTFVGRYHEDTYNNETRKRCVAVIPIAIGDNNYELYYGIMLLSWTKQGDANPTYRADISYNGTSVTQKFGTSGLKLFGNFDYDISTDDIIYDEDSHTFTIPDTISTTGASFTLLNSIESGGSGSGAGVSDVDWTGQYTADNGVELGTLTITTTD